MPKRARRALRSSGSLAGDAALLVDVDGDVGCLDGGEAGVENGAEQSHVENGADAGSLLARLRRDDIIQERHLAAGGRVDGAFGPAGRG